MKRNLTIGVTILVLILLVVIVTNDSSKSGDALIGDTLNVVTFTHNGIPTGTLLLQVPFLEERDEHISLSIAIDSNSNEQFEEAEVLAQDVPLVARKNWHGGWYVSTEQSVPDGGSAEVKVGSDTYALSVNVESVEVGTLLDLESITDPENAMKGLGANTAYAEETVEVTQENVPDISQQPGECAPTAAANSLISLIGKHGKPADLPGTPGEIIEDLKQEMKWTRANGVPPDDFVAGKNAWAKRHGLPIETKKVGDVNGIDTLDAIKEALQNGAAVELRIKFAEAGSNKAAGGHMVTVTGIHQAEGQTYLDINDPYTPEGTETVEIQANQLTNYGPWEGITVMSWGFVQTWSIGGETGSQTTATSLDTTPVAVEMAYDHVKPGEYSEVYAVVMTTPGNEVTAKLTGPAVDFKGTQYVTADKNGQARFTWKIYQYGTYSVEGGTESGNPFTGSIMVQ